PTRGGDRSAAVGAAPARRSPRPGPRRRAGSPSGRAGSRRRRRGSPRRSRRSPAPPGGSPRRARPQYPPGPPRVTSLAVLDDLDRRALRVLVEVDEEGAAVGDADPPRVRPRLLLRVDLETPDRTRLLAAELLGADCACDRRALHEHCAVE